MPKEPIAITGIGCRFPGGANDPVSFWKLLRDGVDAIVEVPKDRWNLRAFYDQDPSAPGKMHVRHGGFIEGIDQFDPEFFGISLREAPCIDPQQRLLLEVAWEALEDGGEVLDVARGSNTGVFVGISNCDYQGLQGTFEEGAFVNIYTNMGYATSIAANRISYCLNLLGPSIALDTACSSSLSAVHLACQSLWDGQCSLALAGGANAMLSPMAFIALGTASMLSPDGRCKTFDAAANGYVRGEGAGMVLLKPLSRALIDGSPIYAVVRGTAANQDGRSIGITVPNGNAQQALAIQACRAAGILPSEVYYVEAHGTGTPVGDPIEAHALSGALCCERANGSHCVIGSVKTNIGHLEAGAGVAGVIKVALMLRHRMIPPHLNLVTPNPNIDFEKLKLRVPRHLEPLPTGRVISGVNSFGFGGANAHAILESPPAESRISHLKSRNNEPEPVGPSLLPLSARSVEVLPELARRYAGYLTQDIRRSESRLRDICYTASLRRSHHEHRLAVVAASATEFAEKLEAFGKGESRPGLFSGHVQQERKLGFVFSGQGPQWWGMGRQLLAREPSFRQKIEECDALLRRWSRWSLLEELLADEQHSRLHETAIAQPAIFSLQVALVALWDSWGVKPDMVVGHSVGEIAAAHIAGVLSIDEAARTIFHRGRCMELAPATGRMLAAALPEPEARSLLQQQREDRVSLAAVNSPRSVTFSGDAESLEALQGALKERDVFCRFLRVQYAFHSAQMDPVQPELIESLIDLEVRSPRLSLFSSVLGSAVDGARLDAVYWWRNVRETVRFANAINCMLQGGCTDFLEISPHPVLSSALLECARERSVQSLVTPSLRRGEEEQRTMLTALGALHSRGYAVNWDAMFPQGGRCLHLPLYTWKHQRYWQETDSARAERLPDFVHPLLGRRFRSANPYWTGKIEGKMRPLLADHRVEGKIVIPAAAYVEMALAAGRQLHGTDACMVEDLELRKPLFLAETGEGPRLQFSYNPTEKTFQILSRPKDSQEFWVLHCCGSFAHAPGTDHLTEDLAKLQGLCQDEIPTVNIYRQFADRGLQYGPQFQGISRIWRGKDEVLSWIELAVPEDDDTYQVSPWLLDSCFQSMLTASEDGFGDKLFLPLRIERLRLHSRFPKKLWCHARVMKKSGGMVEGRFRILRPDGKLLLEIDGFEAQAVEGSRNVGSSDLDNALHEFQWQLLPRTANAAQAPPDLLPNLPGFAKRLQQASRRTSHHRQRLRLGQLEKDTDQLCAYYIIRALRQLGCKLQAGKQLCAASAYSQVAPQHRMVLGRYLQILEDDGVLRKTKSGWLVSETPRVTDGEEFWRSMFTRAPALLPELWLVRLCGLRLAEVLQGQADPLNLLFRDNSFIEQVYGDSISIRPCLGVVKQTIEKVVANLPEGRKLRVLELGSGTGGLTSAILPELAALRPEQIEYVFTDLSSHFLSNAEQRFQDRSFMRFRMLDLEKPPSEQGFAEHSFDLVLASHVLHATSDLRRSLTHIKQLLAGNGFLVVVEFERLSRWVELVFALTKGWWSFTDADLRSGSPLLKRVQWLRLLKEQGFVDSAAVSEIDGMVLLAQGPASVQRADLIPSTPAAARRTWLLFAGEDDLGRDLAARFAARGDKCYLVTAGLAYQKKSDIHFQIRPVNKEDMRRVVDAAARSGALSRIVFLWGADGTEAPEPSLQEINQEERRGCHTVLALVQALADLDHPPQLWLITRGTQPVGRNHRMSVAQSSLWGLGRVIMNEHPRLRCRMIDLGMPGEQNDAESVAEELYGESGDDEIALRGSARYVLHVAHSSALRRGICLLPNGSPFRLEITKPGVLDDLVLRPIKRRHPGPGEVEIEIEAAALNFRDLMKALGMYPRDLHDYFMIGSESAGRVVAVGKGVTNFRVGDRVVGLVTPALSSHVTCPVSMVVRYDRNLSAEDAVTVPVAFVTATYALRQVGQMTAGERVLIHSAAGGVGLAAVQIALAGGCEVFATAGNAEKRELLRVLGAHHVMDSHTLTFADEVMEITRGGGVDIVLNSLAGEALTRSLALLRDGGRFIEIGKRDIYGNSKIGLRPFRKDISLRAPDFHRLVLQDLPLVRRLWREIMSEIKKGNLHPLPRRLFPMTDAVAAFRYMMRGTHIGKIILTLTGKEAVMEPLPDTKKLRFHSKATYLITGGLSGFGLATAQWLAQRGAHHLVLVGRSGASSDTARQAVEELRRKSVNVTIAKADVSSEIELAAVLGDVRSTLPPLRGVIHAAMVLDDGIVLQLDPERFRKVTAPKIDGAWNLHCQTQDDPLDFFVLFSSVSSVIGISGQGNYAAANTFLDSLAHYRRRQGLPGLSVNWGAIRGVGYVERHQAVKDALAHTGLKTIDVDAALDALGRLLQTPCPEMGVIDLDWNHWAKTLGAVRVPARCSSLISRIDDANEDVAEGKVLREAILSAVGAARQELMESFVRRQAAQVMRSSPASLDVSKPLHELGLDSLMAVELSNRIEGELGLALPSGTLMGSQNLSGMAVALVKIIEGSSVVVDHDSDSSVRVTAPNDTHQLDSLSSLGGDRDYSSPIQARDLANEVQLDPSIQGNSARSQAPPAPTQIFLTGATGFIGPFLLCELLMNTRAKIHCLVRGLDEAIARARLEEKLKSFGLWADEFSDRLVPIAGYLERPRFGLEASRFDSLGETVDCIFHAGASISLVHLLPQLKPANVDGTVEILRLASRRTAPVHHISTMFVFGVPENGASESLSEDRELAAMGLLHGGYAQTKWIAEKLVQDAAGRGFSCTIYRLGLVGGDTRRGVCNSNDIFWRFIKGCLQLGVIPDLNAPINLTPVDFASRAIRSLALRPESESKVYHLGSRYALPIKRVVERLRARGYQVRESTYDEWRREIESFTVSGKENELAPFRAMFPIAPDGTRADRMPTLLSQNLDCQKTWKTLESLSLTCPPADDGLLDACFGYLEGQGFLTRPEVAAKL